MGRACRSCTIVDVNSSLSVSWIGRCRPSLCASARLATAIIKTRLPLASRRSLRISSNCGRRNGHFACSYRDSLIFESKAGRFPTCSNARRRRVSISVKEDLQRRRACEMSFRATVLKTDLSVPCASGWGIISSRTWLRMAQVLLISSAMLVTLSLAVATFSASAYSLTEACMPAAVMPTTDPAMLRGSAILCFRSSKCFSLGS